MSDGQDRIIAKVRETLRGAPEAVPDQRKVAQLLNTVWESPRPSAWRRFMDAWRVPALSGFGATAVAAFALLGGIGLTKLIDRGQPEPMAATGEFPTQGGATPVLQASLSAREDTPVSTQFVLDRSDATSVSLVGDFNEWQGEVTPLTRLESGLWTVSVELRPGRHVYAFLIDGTLMVADPRAPKAGDSDYGQEGSVVMVFAR